MTREAVAGGPVFVVGASRSGTTLLGMMLGRHPRLAMTFELLGPLAALLEPARHGRLRSGADVLDEALRLPRVRRHGVDEAAVRRRFAELVATGRGTALDAVNAVFEVWAQAAGKPRWGEKATVSELFHLDAIATIWPTASFVHLLRDGREVADSLLDASFGSRHVIVSAGRWAEAVQAGRSAGRRLGPRYLEERYDRLVADPEATLSRVCEFVGEAFDPAVLDHRPAVEGVGDLPRHYTRLLEPVTPGVRDQQTRWSEQDRRRVEALIGPMLDELGYERRVPAASEAEVRAAVRRYRVLRAASDRARRVRARHHWLRPVARLIQ